MTSTLSTSSHATRQSLQRLRLTARGQVQGVGFRPFIFRLARDLQLTGSVGNTSDGVHIEVQGREEQVRRFPELLRSTLPPLARLTGLEIAPAPVREEETAFQIVLSHGQHGHHVLISPDVGICDDCLADMHDPHNRRYQYPFTNCTNCGPRYTITRSIPYDRPVTSMACFPLCPDCAREYGDPLDRRFHAQPIACPVCGPHLWFVEAGDLACGQTECTEKTSSSALQRTVQALLDGRIVALRGLGGFQLACDARNEQSVALLRTRKHRPHKSFALMARDMATVRLFCHVSAEEEALMTAPARPAMVLSCKKEQKLPLVAPDIGTLAFMLPTTPLHVVLFDLLFEQCQHKGLPVPVLVMTSGNDSGDPICLGNREALRRLARTADCFLLHDRDILCRVDDSVVLCDTALGKPAPLFLRRARGYVPSPIDLGLESDCCVLGTGADLKATCCLTRGGNAFVGQHTGDLEHPATAAFYEEIVRHLSSLLEVTPGLVVTDLHPDFYSSRAGERIAREHGIPLIRLQHHAAHAAAVLAEHRQEEPALALILDGFGLGCDKTVWGGELLRMHLGAARWERAGHLAPFPLPGGDAATHNPWRIAMGLAQADADHRAFWTQKQGAEAGIVSRMIERNLNTPLTSSCGRLFDAVSAQLGLCSTITYEGQAAIRLETCALQIMNKRDSLTQQAQALTGDLPAMPAERLCMQQDASLLVSSKALFARVLRLQDLGLAASLIALDFHWQLARALSCLAAQARREEDVVALGGGVLNNTLLRGLLCSLLQEQGFRVLLPRLLPPGDGGLSLGQAVWGLMLHRLGQNPA